MSDSRALRIDALLSLQRALWNMVTPELRAVAIRVESDQVSGRFLYQRDPDVEERQIVAEVETEVIADLPREVEVTFVAVGVSPPAARELEVREEWVYLRRECSAE